MYGLLSFFKITEEITFWNFNFLFLNLSLKRFIFLDINLLLSSVVLLLLSSNISARIALYFSNFSSYGIISVLIKFCCSFSKLLNSFLCNIVILDKSLESVINSEGFESSVRPLFCPSGVGQSFSHPVSSFPYIFRNLPW